MFDYNLNNKLYQFYEKEGYLLMNQSYKGEGIRIALLDSGIDYYNQSLTSVHKGYSMFGDPNYYFDNIGHGTYMASLLVSSRFGLVPRATVIPVKVINEDGRSHAEIIAGAIYYCIDNKIDIIYLPIQFSTYSENFVKAIKEAKKRNILIISSFPKNYSKDIVYYPLCLEEVLTVGRDYYAYNGLSYGAGIRNAIDKDEGSTSVEAIVAVIFFTMILQYFREHNIDVNWDHLLKTFDIKGILYDNILSYQIISEKYQFDLERIMYECND